MAPLWREGKQSKAADLKRVKDVIELLLHKSGLTFKKNRPWHRFIGLVIVKKICDVNTYQVSYGQGEQMHCHTGWFSEDLEKFRMASESHQKRISMA